MLEQVSQAATAFARSGGDWIGHVLTGDTDLPLPELGVSVPLREIYTGIEFPESTADA